MKTRGVALTAHQSGGTTTLAWCWKVTRRDSQVFGFTSVDMDLLVGGVLYAAATGFTPSAVDGKTDLSVANMETSGMLSSAAITESDLLAGVWDGATVEIFEVNYGDLTQGIMSLSAGTIGNVSAGRVAFKAELRALQQPLQQPFGRLYAPGCQAKLGDTECKVALGPLTVTGTVTTATSARAFTDSARAEASDYFGAGLITWTGGANAGRSMEVMSFSGGAFALVLPMASVIAVGDTYSAIPGCRKRLITDCKTKYNNVPNFRGHPYVPGNDSVLGNAALAAP